MENFPVKRFGVDLNYQFINLQFIALPDYATKFGKIVIKVGYNLYSFIKFSYNIAIFLQIYANYRYK